MNRAKLTLSTRAAQLDVRGRLARRGLFGPGRRGQLDGVPRAGLRRGRSLRCDRGYGAGRGQVGEARGAGLFELEHAAPLRPQGGNALAIRDDAFALDTRARAHREQRRG